MRRGAGTALGETDGRRLRFKGAAAESTVASAIASVSVTAAIRPGERVARPRPETGFAAARSSQRARRSARRGRAWITSRSVSPRQARKAGDSIKEGKYHHSGRICGGVGAGVMGPLLSRDRQRPERRPPGGRRPDRDIGQIFRDGTLLQTPL